VEAPSNRFREFRGGRIEDSIARINAALLAPPLADDLFRLGLFCHQKYIPGATSRDCMVKGGARTNPAESGAQTVCSTIYPF